MQTPNTVTIVGLDLETTALEPERGEIIEVAAVRYSLAGKRLEDTYVRLCKPARAISAEITTLTGITNEMVAEAPVFSELVEELAAFIGDSLIFAHNASFDLKWLNYHGLSLEKNKVWDTFIIAAVAWPEAESYNLGALDQEYGGGRSSPAIPLGPEKVRGEHSAAYDVEMAWRVLKAARLELSASPATYKRILELLERAGLGHYAPLFRERRTGSTPERIEGLVGMVPEPKRGATRPDPSEQVAGRARMSERDEPVRRDQSLTSILGEGGLLAQRWPGFVPREPQQRMAELVHSLLQKGGVGLIEAPTGSGKTLAYLTPLFQQLQEAKKSERPTKVLTKDIISTYTKHLQDQLLAHDVPTLQRMLGIEARVAVLKGRRNYLCARRLGLAWEKAEVRPDHAWFLIKARLWLEKGGSGDLDHLNNSHQGEPLPLHADSLVCRRFCGRQMAKLPQTSQVDSGEAIEREAPLCPYQRAILAAEAAEVLIVNHALLADPNFTARWTLGAVIVDEAHHVEDAMRRATAASLNDWHLEDIIGPILQRSVADSTTLRHLRVEATELVADFRALVAHLGEFAAPRQSGLPTHHGKPIPHSAVVRLTPPLRRSSQWGVLEKSLAHWVGRCRFIIGLLEGSSGLPAGLAGSLSAAEAGDIRDSLQTFSDAFSRFVNGSPDRIQWIEIDDQPYRRDHDSQIYLHDVALAVTPQLQRLYTEAHSVVFTSATLTTRGNFAFIKDILGVESASELILSSSFPLSENLLIYLVDDAPDPRSAGYDRYIGTNFGVISRLLGGRTLGLFTSFKSVSAVYEYLIRALNKETIKVYAQGHSGGKSNMLKRFRDNPRSVLLGTDSFWEGIDIPGDTLSCVAIAKLPFAPPHEPVVEAVSEARQVDSFEAISLPNMILKLRQGIGRLIRQSSDRGVVVIFDSRLHHSLYGDAVIKSLPAGRIKIGSTADVPNAIRSWIGEGVVERWNSQSSLTDRNS